MTIRLTLGSTQLNNEDIATIARQLCEDINRETPFHASFSEIGAPSGTRGKTVNTG